MAADPPGRSLRALEDERAWRPRAATVGGVAQAVGSSCSDSPYIYVYIISQDGSRPPGSPRLRSPWKMSVLGVIRPTPCKRKRLHEHSPASASACTDTPLQAQALARIFGNCRLPELRCSTLCVFVKPISFRSTGPYIRPSLLSGFLKVCLLA